MCQSRTLTEDCLRHAAARDVEMNIFATLTHATPQPMKLMPRIYGTVQRYLPAQISESMSRDMMIRFQASKVGAVFSVRHVPDSPLRFVHKCILSRRLGSRDQWSHYVEEPWMKECGTELTNALAAGWGWKTWESLHDSTVQQAYRQLCTAVQNQQLKGQTVPDARTDSSK